MHWGLMAQKEHKEINLSSLRMLLVADGANPCKYLSHGEWGGGYWGLMAQKEHKEINLSLLRMLLVADGVNPCKYLLRLKKFFHQLAF